MPKLWNEFAFPSWALEFEGYRDGSAVGRSRDHENGICVIDYFAARAMQAVAASLPHSRDYDWHEEVARRSYLIAEAMCGERILRMEGAREGPQATGEGEGEDADLISQREQAAGMEDVPF